MTPSIDVSDDLETGSVRQLEPSGVRTLWRVAVDAPLSEPLTYQASSVCHDLKRGQRVIVPLGRRQAEGVVLGPADSGGDYELREILGLAPKGGERVLPAPVVEWLEWLAQYYLYPIGQVMALAFPPLAQAGARRRPPAPNPSSDTVVEPAPQLTVEQKTCVDGIARHQQFSVHLLHGVTGSGKTEVYLQLLQRVVGEGQTALVLVPEIALTPQLVARFSARFPNQVAVIHSHLTNREKTNQWWDMLSGKKKILIGARSALFCPLTNLGMIVIDEEHEPSFKQEEMLKYHARDAAIMRARFQNCPVVLGSATPSLESWENARLGRYHLWTMKDRVEKRPLPTIEIIDVRELRQLQKLAPPEKAPLGPDQLPFWLSPSLHQAMDQTLKKGEQCALFLNRRGIAQTVVCPDCGFVSTCPNCAISLTLHAHRHLVCHYCNYEEMKPDICPDCHEGTLRPLGLGTELIEEDVQSLFPEARTARADRDEIQNRRDLEEMIRQMESGEIQILIGTQMIAKGLDFPKLTLVGLVMADVGFHLPDFRATERSFQLITQVSGRAGRHQQDPGRVLIQTYTPNHPAIQFAQAHDYQGFVAQERLTRAELSYPPFARLAALRFQGLRLNQVEASAATAANRAHFLCSQRESYRPIQVLGPAPSPLAKLRNQYRFLLLFKSPTAHLLNHFCRELLGHQKWLSPGVRAIIDIDPLHLL